MPVPLRKLQPTRTVRWSVHGRDTAGRTLYETHPLEAPYAVRHWHSTISAWPDAGAVTLTEHVTVEVQRYFDLEALPGGGQPTPLPELADGAHEVGRHYRFRLCGPYVLPTGDDVRAWHAWAVTNGVARPEELRLVEVTLTRYRRTLTRDELPAH